MAPQVGYGATTTAVVLNNAAGMIATLWQRAADASRDFQGDVLSLGHDGLVAKGFPDDGHNPADPTACAPGLMLYIADVMKNAADLWNGDVDQPAPFSFSNATRGLRMAGRIQ